MDKRGIQVIGELLVFVLLNFIFFGAMITHVVISSSGATIYEQTYAKNIALLADVGKPGMKLQMDMTKGLRIFENKVLDRNFVQTTFNGMEVREIVNDGRIQNIVKFNSDNEVVVSFTGRGGYSYGYFSDYCIEKSIDDKGVLTLEFFENDDC